MKRQPFASLTLAYGAAGLAGAAAWAAGLVGPLGGAAILWLGGAALALAVAAQAARRGVAVPPAAREDSEAEALAAAAWEADRRADHRPGEGGAAAMR